MCSPSAPDLSCSWSSTALRASLLGALEIAAQAVEQRELLVHVARFGIELERALEHRDASSRRPEPIQ